MVALFQKGATLYKLDGFSKAIECFDQIILVDPKHIDSMYNKGLALDKLGKTGRQSSALMVSYTPTRRIRAP